MSILCREVSNLSYLVGNSIENATVNVSPELIKNLSGFDLIDQFLNIQSFRNNDENKSPLLKEKKVFN